MPLDAPPTLEPVRTRPSRARGTETAERRRLEQDVRHALAHDGFRAHYQPRQELASGAVVAAEAVPRLPARRRSTLAAPVHLAAEQVRLGEAVSGWLLRAACAEAASWDGAPTLGVSVKLPAGLLQDGSLLRHLAEALEQSGLAPERLELALPEAALLAPDPDMLLALAAVRDRGVGLIADEFGLAVASLCSLRHLPLTAVKLDRSLVRDLLREEEDRGLLQAVAAAARTLRLRVVAEGMESEAQRDILAACGCDEAQGSLVSYPLPGPELLTLVAPPSAELGRAA